MRKVKNFLLFILIGLFLISFDQKEETGSKDTPEIRNIIFMIGDGMGLPAVYAAMSVSDHPLNFERCTFTGFQKNTSSDGYITDSAAAATALASGTKTNNGCIGVDPHGNHLKTILEIAEEHGLATGLVSTSSITHATPASFIAHDTSRNNYENIARDFLKTDIDVFIGGGYDHFANRTDKLNLIDSLKIRGYEVQTSMDLILKSSALKLAGLTAPNQNPYRLKGRGDMLTSSSAKAIEILSKNRKGFFLMIEGSQIDWAGHANEPEMLIDETLDFDKALGVVLDFAEKDKHTLVVVTADHETGGVSIVGGSTKNHTVKLNFSSKSHTADMIPVFSFGPGAEKFTGILDNTEFFPKFLAGYGFRK